MLTDFEVASKLAQYYYATDNYASETWEEVEEDFNPESEYPRIWDELAWAFDKPKAIEGLGEVLVVENHGGEGQGDERWVVFKVTNDEGEFYYRKDGYYASYDGSTWDGSFGQVQKTERLVTFYE